jgi:signal transduction histidine kinase
VRLKALNWIIPQSMAGQMIAVLALAFAVLLAVMTIAEQTGPGDVVEAAQSTETAMRIDRMLSGLSRVHPADMADFVRAESRCHFGYELSHSPYQSTASAPEAQAGARRLAERLARPAKSVRMTRASLEGDAFGYAKCPQGEIKFPVEGVVVSVALADGRWLHTEVHPHEPHFRQSFNAWFQRSALAFALVAAVAAVFMYRLGRPLRSLTEGAARFGAGLTDEPLPETGPPDLRRTIGAFNAMQRQVTDEIARRTNTLAALSHDLRTPLTALRVKAELVEDEKARNDLIASIEKMEAISASAIEFLKGEARTEPLRLIDLSALVEAECAEFEAIGKPVQFVTGSPVQCVCRPEALSRAVRNLIDNAVKYGGGAEVSARSENGLAKIAVSDKGPGIPDEAIASALEPFVRLSPAQEGDLGGFGLGLSVVQSIARGHDGWLTLVPNQPVGLVATIRIPQHRQHSVV